MMRNVTQSHQQQTVLDEASTHSYCRPCRCDAAGDAIAGTIRKTLRLPAQRSVAFVVGNGG